MRDVFRIVACTALFATITSCSHCPRSGKDSEAIQQIRLEYIRSNPEGQYNDHVLKGEVIKGMGFMGVLASWGLPNVRSITKPPVSIGQGVVQGTEGSPIKKK
ncbi:MAG: hypothetical protein HY770_05710 [Chitinivibrionia bacterium]|nr:hypothetical protein [Chitinivibrionia bacterium]